MKLILFNYQSVVVVFFSDDIDVLPFFSKWLDNYGLNHGKQNVIANFALST